MIISGFFIFCRPYTFSRTEEVKYQLTSRGGDATVKKKIKQNSTILRYGPYYTSRSTTRMCMYTHNNIQCTYYIGGGGGGGGSLFNKGNKNIEKH